MKRRHYKHRVLHCIPIKQMSEDERRAYQRERQAEYRARQAAHALLHGPDRKFRPRPSEINCQTCGELKPFTKEYFAEDKRALWGLWKRCRKCTTLDQLARKFGITPDEYKKLTTGCCAICGTEGKLHLDHCHDSGNIREGLCNSCNTGLGMFRDDPDRLRVAALYVERHRLLT